MRRKKIRVSYWIPILIVILLISLIVGTQNSENIDVYTTKGTEATVPSTTTPAAKIDLVERKIDKLNASIGIPSDWTKVIKDGHLTFIHSPSTSSAQIQVTPYSPKFLSANENAVRSELFASNLTLLSFRWLTNSNYMMVYMSGTEEKGVIYIENLTFDKEHAVRVVLTMPSEFYERMFETMQAIATSFKWEKDKPYPEELVMVYNSYGDFEFAYPATWKTGIQNNVYLTQDPNNGTMMSVTVNQSTAVYSEMNQLDYYKWVSGRGYSNLSIQNFQINDSCIYAISMFSTNSGSMILVHYLVATGSYEYILTFEIPYAVYSATIDTVSTLINHLRIYNVPSAEGTQNAERKGD